MDTPLASIQDAPAINNENNYPLKIGGAYSLNEASYLGVNLTSDTFKFVGG